MPNRQEDLFHLIGKLEATLDNVKDRKVECNKCFDDIKEDIKEHKADDEIKHNKIWRHIYYSLALGGLTFVFIIAVAKDDDTIIQFLNQLLKIFII